MSTALDAATTLLLDLGQLQLAARSLAHGALVGLHRSPRRGASSEFSEHTLYSPGDDPRHLDWRAYAKTERFYIKRFADETNLRVHLLVDASGSMSCTGGTWPSKFAAPTGRRSCPFWCPRAPVTVTRWSAPCAFWRSGSAAVASG